jgi:hypothetical protein
MLMRRNLLKGAAAGVPIAMGSVARWSATALAQTGTKTFVLAHGSWHGGWCWKKVADRLVLFELRPACCSPPFFPRNKRQTRRKSMSKTTVTVRSSVRYALVALAASLVPAFALAEDAIIKLPQEVSYKAPLPGVPEVAVLFGDPRQSGLYVTRVKIPAGLKLVPHWHPDEVRTVVVLSGTLLHGYGDRWDESKLKPHPPGTFFSEPSKAPHFAWAKDGEVVLQITATGPTATTNIPQPEK